MVRCLGLLQGEDGCHIAHALNLSIDCAYIYTYVHAKDTGAADDDCVVSVGVADDCVVSVGVGDGRNKWAQSWLFASCAHPSMWSLYRPLSWIT